jgi:hypothetical protein
MPPTRHAKDPPTRKRVTPRLARPRKRQKRNDSYDDLEAILGDHKSPLFEEGVNIKVFYFLQEAAQIAHLDRTLSYTRRL